MPIKHHAFDCDMPIEHLHVIGVEKNGMNYIVNVVDDFGTEASFDLRSSVELSTETNASYRKLWECKHDGDKEVRTKIAVNGREMVGAQCLNCGRKVGDFLKKVDWPKIRPLWDEGLIDRCREEIERQNYPVYLKYIEIYQQRGEEYGEYLNSWEWKEKRRLVMVRDKGICQGCLVAPASEVHHLTYSHIYNELLFQLVALCSECHENFHAVQNKNRNGDRDED